MEGPTLRCRGVGPTLSFCPSQRSSLPSPPKESLTPQTRSFETSSSAFDGRLVGRTTNISPDMTGGRDHRECRNRQRLDLREEYPYFSRHSNCPSSGRSRTQKPPLHLETEGRGGSSGARSCGGFPSVNCNGFLPGRGYTLRLRRPVHWNELSQGHIFQRLSFPNINPSRNRSLDL